MCFYKEKKTKCLVLQFLIWLAVGIVIAFPLSSFIILNSNQETIPVEHYVYGFVMMIGFINVSMLVLIMLARAVFLCVPSLISWSYNAIIEDIARKKLDLQNITTENDSL